MQVDETFRNQVFKLLKIADLGIADLYFEKKQIQDDEIPEPIKKLILKRLLTGGNMGESIELQNIIVSEQRLQFIHNQYTENKKLEKQIHFKFEEESSGTQKMFGLSGPLIDTLLNGKVLVIDELDARLHPQLVKYIIRFFNSKDKNPNNAQLIFATHNINILDKRYFRRDQIWFTEKNKYGATELYSLIDYRVRNDATFYKDYQLGKYGAIHYIADNTITELYGKKK